MQHISVPVHLSATFGETFNHATTSGYSNIAPARPDLTWFRDNRFNDTEPNTTQYDVWQRFFMLKSSGKIRILINFHLTGNQYWEKRNSMPGDF
ncbi:hypothetical protein CGCSCA4_v012892 [Colletotrichum siamense]|uniref:Uncharacterized protein n=1 Tax=Colletotrichum siamense TaxID=690259 RepID=A0A9P5BQU8_COLSI|nr:hypothetical protein CGCSCA4_v012892 [Colletotrichum siamense]KAF4848761.1 hypothetical protein CGCSCA2_v012249 [Colletotrichum siamense]